MKHDLNITATLPEHAIIIRDGKAEDIKIPQKINFIGVISAPAMFAEDKIKRQMINKDKALATVDVKQNSIKFYVDPTNEDADTVTGTFTYNQDLLNFGINGVKNYPTKEFDLAGLIKFLRMNKMHFSNEELFNNFLGKLNNFSSNLHQSLNKSNDNRGNITLSLEQTVKSDLPNKFTLELPIFNGALSSKFEVDIFYDVRDANVTFWFESVELKELIEKQQKELIETEVQNFEKLGVLVLFS